MKAILKNYRQAPRKTALIAGLIRGKSVNCIAGQETITIKNKETGEIETLTFEELMERENGTS
jgi:ribosomal protein L22